MSDDNNSFSGIISILDFIQANPRLVISTNPYNVDYLMEIYESNNQSEKYSSCFWIPPLLSDVLRLEYSKRKEVSILDLSPGHYYYFSSSFHVWSILYLTIDQIYLVDFYMETGRPSFLQSKKITPDMLSDYQKAIIDNDIDKFADMHDGDQGYTEDLYENQKSDKYFKMVDKIYELPLNYEVVLDDLFRVLLRNSSPHNDYTEKKFYDYTTDDYDYTTEDFYGEPAEALIKAKQHHEENMNQVRLLFAAYQKDNLVKKSTMAI